MRKELKKAIIDWIFDNSDAFNLVNACADAFRPYIYDAGGGYLIGGADVLDFIRNQYELLQRY